MNVSMLTCLRRAFLFCLLSAVLLSGGFETSQAFAQAPFFNLGGGDAFDSAPDVTADITLQQGTGTKQNEVTLVITANVRPGAHVYSTTTDFAGKTKVDIKAIRGLKPLDDDLSASDAPVKKFDDALMQEVEYHEGEITWTRRFELESGASPSDVLLAGNLTATVCDDSTCRPFSQKFELMLEAAPVVFTHNYQPTMRRGGNREPGPIRWQVTLDPPNAKPGDTVLLTMAVALDDGWHTFATDSDGISRPTVFTLTALHGLATIDGDDFKPDHASENADNGDSVHHGQVAWTRRLTVTDGGVEGYGVFGRVNFQYCSTSCVPGRFEFTVGTVPPGVIAAGLEAEATPSASVESAPPASPELAAAAEAMFETLALRGPEEAAERSLWMYLVFAFVGGLILNVMPCVLPVLAIKVLSFVQQAGEQRSRILLLNLCYTGGVLVVFMSLASMAVFADLAWGGLFQQAPFIVAMAGLVFAMALSLLGVFEIPIPGMVGSAGAHQREGLSGAFMTGIFATLLATPCSGPFLGTTLGWSVQQPAHIVYLVWGMMGLGMASPYVLFGMFPAAVRFLPKPGNWMVTFKQLAGFVLLGTVVYLISILGERYVIPTLILLLGIGLSLWMIGSLYDLSSAPSRRWKVRILALALGGGIGMFALNLSRPGPELKWEKFSTQTLTSHLLENRVVMIDFTADWCPNCKVVEKISLNTVGTQALLKEHNIVAIKADWTDHGPEIKDWLDRFESNSIPLTAIFTPARPNEPIIIRDVYTEATLHKWLNMAVQETAPASQTPPVAAVESSRR